MSATTTPTPASAPDCSRQATTDPGGPVRVWDLPTRLFHWLFAGAVLGAWALSESERLRALHVMLGYTAAGLVVFRLAWGVVGTRHARFANWPWSPRALAAYLRSLAAGRPRHHVGHNPAGSWAVALLVGGVAATTLTGWAGFVDVGPAVLQEVHEQLANATVALAALHVTAVLVSSLLHRENLVRGMIDGRKRGTVADALEGTRPIVAAAMLSILIAFWGGWIPAPGLARAPGLAGLRGPAARVGPAGPTTVEAPSRPARNSGNRRDDD